MYADELSNSVQSIDLQDPAVLSEIGNKNEVSTEPEDSSIEQCIKSESKPIMPPGYHISHCLAEGAMGRVFLVINPDTKDCLASKVVSIYRQYGNNPSLKEPNVAKVRADLRQEAELQRRLKHHNIATLYGIRNTASYTFMFMELLPGGELFDRIPIGVGLHVQQMFIYYTQILDALDYLHSTEFIAHLDVKPENIMLTKKDRAKLIDFGWAVDLKKTPLINGPVGTPSYAAPEVFEKSPYSGPKADLFSLGVTLLTAVTGQRCWSRANPSCDLVYKQWIHQKHLHTGPVFARLPPDLANFLTRALAHSPAERLSVAEIRSHPWFKRGLCKRLTPVAAPHSSNSDLPRGVNPCFQIDTPVPSSQPILTNYLSQNDAVPNSLHLLSQPADVTSMLIGTQNMHPQWDMNGNDLGFSYLMRRMTRFFSALSTLDHTLEVIRAVIVQKRQLRATVKGFGNLLVDGRSTDHLVTSFRVLLYPLAGSILVDCRRVSGDGLLFHQTYAAIYSDLLAMGAVNNSHPYLNIVLPERADKTESN